MTDGKAEIVLRESAAIVDAHTLLQAPVEELDPDTQLTAYSVLSLFEKEVIGKRQAVLKASLLAIAKATGTKNANGSFKAKMEDSGWAEARARSGNVEVNESKLKELLAAKGIPEEEVFKSVTTIVMSQEAVMALVTLGKISAEEFKAFTSVGETTYSLYVGKPDRVKKLIG